MSKIFPGGQELPGNGKDSKSAKNSAQEKPPSYEFDFGGATRGVAGPKETERSTLSPREVGVGRKITLIDEVIDALLEKSPEREAQVLELRSKEFSRVETSLLETIVMSSADAEWQSDPLYWKALIEELKSRI